MIRVASKPDWKKFLALAISEGWRVPRVESRLFQGDWLPFVRVLEDGGTFCGLVTAVPHQRSGWIGNLIVPQEFRGQGYGSQLFSAALSALEERQLDTVWLTASEMGQPLYEKHGFVKVGEIERWLLPARAGSGSAQSTTTEADSELRLADQQAWGEDRQALLNCLIMQGKSFACEDTVALLQQEKDMQVIGPWYSPLQCPRANRLVLQQLLAHAEPGVNVVADVLTSSPVRQLLAAADFTCVGRNALMVKGETDGIDLTRIVSSASLGSIG